jgi:hypothetical protein
MHGIEYISFMHDRINPKNLTEKLTQKEIFLQFF